MTDDENSDDVSNPRLTDAEIDALARNGSRRSLRDGQALFQSGDQRGGFFIILKGTVAVIDHSVEPPVTIAVHGPGQFTGDIDILRRRRTVVSAVARGETEVLGISSNDVRRLIGELPRLGETILQAFIARREELLETGFVGVRVIGSGASRESFRLREFLSRNQVPLTWVDATDDPGVGEMLRNFGVATEDLPVVAIAGQPLMRRPSIREVAEVLDLRRPIRNDVYDLVIIGAGPAGLGAAVYAASEGLRTLVLEAEAPGGQAGVATRIENYLGFPTGISGAELTGRATLQAQKFNAELSSPVCVVGLELQDTHPRVRLDSGERARARCVLIATGADYSKLDIPGREQFDGVGVFYAATPMELTTCEGRDVVVVGGGNSAGQAAMFLSEHTHRVWLLIRGDDMRRSMSSYLADRVDAATNVEVRHHTEVRRILGTERLEGVLVEDTSTGETRRIDTSAVFSFIGAVPRTDWLPPEVETDAKGFIRTGRSVADSPHWKLEREPYLLETSHAGVFAAGDARLDSITRVASAVGEGAMAIKFVHAYLAETNG